LTYLWPSAPWDLQHALHTSELAWPGTVHALLADLLYLHASNTDISNNSANPVQRRNRRVFARLAMRHANSLVCAHVDGKRRADACTAHVAVNLLWSTAPTAPARVHCSHVRRSVGAAQSTQRDIFQPVCTQRSVLAAGSPRFIETDPESRPSSRTRPALGGFGLLPRLFFTVELRRPGEVVSATEGVLP
jgi:hypothetical protein